MFAELRRSAYLIPHLVRLRPVAPAGSQGQLHSFDGNGLCKPMQSISAHALIYCQGVPRTISIQLYFSWASLMQKQYIS